MRESIFPSALEKPLSHRFATMIRQTQSEKDQNIYIIGVLPFLESPQRTYCRAILPFANDSRLSCKAHAYIVDVKKEREKKRRKEKEIITMHTPQCRDYREIFFRLSVEGGVGWGKEQVSREDSPRLCRSWTSLCPCVGVLHN